MVAPVLVCCGVVLLVVCPWAALLMHPGQGAQDTALHGASALILPTVGWAVLVAVAATVLGRLAAPALTQRTSALTGAVIAAMLPASAVFYVWYAMQPVDSGRWVTSLLLWAALVSTHWPVAALVLRGSVRTAALDSDDAARQLGARLLRRLSLCAGREWPMWLASVALLAALSVLATTAFDLAGVVTAATEVRARAALGASFAGLIGPLLVLSGPAIAGAVAAWMCLGHVPPQGDHERTTPAWPAIVLVMASVTAPLIGLIWITPQVGAPTDGMAGAIVHVVLRGIGIGMLVAMCTMPMVSVCRQLRRGRVRWVHGVVLVWLVAALLPSSFVAAGWSALQQWLPPEFAQWGIGLIAASLVQGTAVAWLIARGMVMATPIEREDALAMVGTRWWRPDHAMGMAMVAAGAVGGVSSVFMPAIESMLAPPAAGPPLVSRLVDAMHYQRPESVVLALWGLLIAAVAVALVIGIMRHRRTVAPLCLLVIMFGCADQSNSSTVQPLTIDAVIGGPGTRTGRFVTPRAAAVHDGVLVVIDRTGRLQHFEDGGVCAVDLPLEGRGFPTGVHLDEHTTAWVADTHSGRVLRIEHGGDIEVFAGPGAAAGEPHDLGTPSDVQPLPDGRVLVSVYGGDDHLALLGADGALHGVIGSAGDGVGQFRRPQALALDAHGQVWVADACNHRLQRVDPETGEVTAVLAPPDMRYPYGLDILPDGDLLVSEYGGNVLRRMSPDGARSRRWGGWGDNPGQLRTPWSVTIDEDAGVLYLVDAGHDRVLRIALQAVAW